MTSALQLRGAASRLLWSVRPIVDIGADGWPARLHVQAVAALQSWRDGDDEESAERKARERDWCQAITNACRGGELAYIVGNVQKTLHTHPGESAAWLIETTSNNFMLACDVRLWLEKNCEAPGPLLGLWFQAAGLAWSPVAVADAAPVVLSLVPSDSREAPAPSTGKVPQKSQAPEWTGEGLAKKRADLKRENPTARNLTQQLSEISGLSVREITRREKAYRDEVQPQGGRATGNAA